MSVPPDARTVVRPDHAVIAPEIPPHTANMSSPRFSSGGPGEWSDPTTSIAPAASRGHSAARSAADRSGGAHFAAAPMRTPSSRVSTRWCGHASHVASTPSARAAATRSTDSGPDRWTMWTAQPVARARSRAMRTADVSAAAGRDAHQSIIVRPPPRGVASSTAGSSAWTATGRPSAAARSFPRPSWSGSTWANSGTPLGLMNALKPTTPRPASSSMAARLPGTSPPHSAKSTRARPRAAATFASNAAPSSVGGIEFSGMSAQQVTPPAASAAVPVSQPSQSARPGSSMWTCPSTIPGSTSSPRASISSRPPGSSGPTAAIRPSSTATSHASPRTTRSALTPPRCAGA